MRHICDRIGSLHALVVPILGLVHGLNFHCSLKLLEVHLPAPDMGPIQRGYASASFALV